MSNMLSLKTCQISRVWIDILSFQDDRILRYFFLVYRRMPWVNKGADSTDGNYPTKSKNVFSDIDPEVLNEPMDNHYVKMRDPINPVDKEGGSV